ncbi:MAG TPA: outer membrane beta-barrel protein [Gemmatimonadaceae bacterium]|nr:outer membrane beta-barrel protein [Gemmatimonadaceae bacterium]
MTTSRSHTRALLGGIVTLCALCMTTRIGRAQTTDSTASDSSRSGARHADTRDRDSTSILVTEHRAELARRGAGLSIGTWNVQDLHATQGATYSITPAFEGYFQKGLDQHLAIETTAGLWRRTQLLTQPGSFGGDSTTQSVSSYIVPLFTTLKIYPFTKPSQHLEPYMLGGVGFALGIDDRRTSGGSGALLGGNAQSGVALVTGFGFTGGAGIEWRFSSAFGLAAGTRYRWIRFLGDVGGDDTFKGMGFDAGVTYRFQY